MPRRANILRPVKLHTAIPEDLHAKLSAFLYSPAEGRVPKGAYQKFICERIVEFFKEHPNVFTES